MVLPFSLVHELVNQLVNTGKPQLCLFACLGLLKLVNQGVAIKIDRSLPIFHCILPGVTHASRRTHGVPKVMASHYIVITGGVGGTSPWAQMSIWFLGFGDREEATQRQDQ